MLTSLRQHFGFTSFRHGQAEAIRHLLAGENALVVMPTGAGKSLIYQLAALHRPGVTLVISPLIALMKDQVDSLNLRSIPATFINSAISGIEQARRLQAMTQNAFRLVYVAPERLRSAQFLQALSKISIGLLAVDESHCLSQWGHDFRPDYLHLATAFKQFGKPPVVALTATATPQVQDDIVRLLALKSAQRIITGFNRANLSFEVHYTSNPSAKLQALKDLMDDLEEGRAIIYTGTRRDAEEVGEFVRSVCATEAEHYHAGLDAEKRSQIQDSFLKGDLPVVVATNAFGMGIDRPDVRMVIHFNVPGTLEAYYQEAGRAGRDGEASRAVLLYDPRDRALQEWFIENDALTPNEARALYHTLQQSKQPEIWISWSDLSMRAELHEVKVKVGLAQLELAGIIQRLGDEGQRMLLRVEAWNEKKLRGISSDVEARRRHRKQQLAKMIIYAESNGCRRQIILDHFGDRGPVDAPRCCDNCLSKPSTPAASPRGDFEKLSLSEQTALIILDAVRRLDWEVGRERLAQMLRGSKAKKMKIGYDQSPYYGRLKTLSLKMIESIIERLIEQKYLKVIGGNLPVLRLTPQGQEAIKARAAISLELPEISKITSGKSKQTGEHVRDTVLLTASLFENGVSPDEIAEQRNLSIKTIFEHLATLIGRGVLPLSAVIEEEIISQVRGVIAQIGDASKLAPIKARLPASISYEEIRCVAEAWKREQETHTPEGPIVERTDSIKPDKEPSKEITDFLSRSHPRPLSGPWHVGWALGFHSSFSGADWNRSPIGELTYRLKYQNDFSVLPRVVEHIVELCVQHPELVKVDGLIPVPPSTKREVNPLLTVVEAVGRKFKLPVRNIIIKTRQTASQKEMHTQAQKRANVAGAYAVQTSVHGQRLLVIDDLYDSGATLEEVARVLHRAGAARVCVLTLTRTIHTDA
jgi:ATP-dependent DNA helicase RecQ